MKLNNISFPYPVLRQGYDDILPSLPDDAIVILVDKNETDFTFNIALNYDNSDIEELVKSGKATYACEIDCIKTVWRESFFSKSKDFTIKISRRDLSGNITFSAYVAVIEPIKGYINKGFNSDYGKVSFDMEPGDILAGFPIVPYHVDIRYDKLQAAGSFLIIKEDVESDVTNFNYDHDKIEINIPTEMFRQYQNGLKTNFAEIMHASLAYNALSCALYELPNCNANLLWVQALNYRLINEFPDDYDPETRIVSNAPAVANKLLKDPYKRLFSKLTEQLENDIEESHG